MNHPSALLDRFKPALISGALSKLDFLIGTERGHKVYYIPFEHINQAARLVLVGITPGPTQMAEAYSVAQRALHEKNSDQDVLLKTKRAAAFSGMRERINEMLDHFAIPRHLGISGASSLWASDFQYFQPTSIVPNAAFKIEAYFNGPFSSVLDVPLLRHQFENIFIPSVQCLSKQTLYIGMGPVVDEALRWCVSQGIIDERQLLGYFPHASGSSGSQFSYFMRRKSLNDLKPKDPVRHRVRDLDAAYERLSSNVQSFINGNSRDIARPVPARANNTF